MSTCEFCNEDIRELVARDNRKGQDHIIIKCGCMHHEAVVTDKMMQDDSRIFDTTLGKLRNEFDKEYFGKKKTPDSEEETGGIEEDIWNLVVDSMVWAYFEGVRAGESVTTPIYQENQARDACAATLRKSLEELTEDREGRTGSRQFPPLDEDADPRPLGYDRQGNPFYLRNP